jgi:branched-subunit amino acid aminotransferase/4-amino-4-deoxychorismate lyase
MHYFLAQREARRQDPEATAVLLDEQGYVSETPTANLVVYLDDEGLVSPPRNKILPGISLQATDELACRRGIPFLDRDLSVEDLARADEILLTSTPYCLLPATRIDNQPVGTGKVGSVFRELMTAWCEMAQVDLIGQAKRFARR